MQRLTVPFALFRFLRGLRIVDNGQQGGQGFLELDGCDVRLMKAV